MNYKEYNFLSATLTLTRMFFSVHVQQDADEVFLSILNLIQQQMSDKALVCTT